MLYLIAEQLGFPGVLNLIRYISFRAGAASATALAIGLFLGPWLISQLRVRQGKGQPIRADGPQSHLAKRGTPTMGGLLILISMATSVLLWMDLRNPYVWACLVVIVGFGTIGFLDDYDKVKKAHHAGLSGKTRLVLEFLIAGVATWMIVQAGTTNLYLPFVQGPVARPRLVLHRVRRLRDRRIRQCGEPDRRARRPSDHAGDHRIDCLPADRLSGRQRPLRRISRHSAHPRRRRPDGACVSPSLERASPSCGSTRRRLPSSWATLAALRLGGALGAVAVATHHEFVLVIIGGLFVLEAASVVIQVVVYKRTGKRVFRMAPIHHHFEHLGWSEPTVVIRFWIVSFILALAGLSTLKLR